MKKNNTVFSRSDVRFMRRALLLAGEVKGRTFPNPAVGALVVKNGRIVGKGATGRYGEDHAERQAIARSGSRAQGATLYVTLEPCHHHGKTPPCTQAIVDAGIAKVIIAVRDPNPLVNGKGIRYLRRKKLAVEVGLMQEDAVMINEDFFWSITRKKPWITVKLACTLDGKIADMNGVSQWITNTEARTFVHELRRRHAAVAVGANTLRTDNPQLSVRLVSGESPARIVFMADSTVPADTHFYRGAKNTRSIVVRCGGVRGAVTIGKDGIETWHVGNRSRRDRMESFLSTAYREGIPSVLVEGGQELAASFFESGCVNRLYIFYGNKIVGKGRDGFAFNKGLPLDACVRLDEITAAFFGDTFMLTGKPERE